MSSKDTGASGSSNVPPQIYEQDQLLPIANVGRIMKKILPANAKIAKEGKETMQECVSEFISFVTGEASDKCRKERRKTVNGDDIVWAIDRLGFDNYAQPLKRYLDRYREAEGDQRANINIVHDRVGYNEENEERLHSYINTQQDQRYNHDRNTDP
ncbi:nuclear transcription factor Y subunit B-5-like [Heracleum sosnowskyi]|uniref:Nuclear transcription factor Y subunit B-5-like n=1 Tax=Heracleum sosnowskyi TaxID=360622 RepID=A0AAD8IIP5_9APIA|nr:nuclear transcription factor Y subunit B-5-like [Heracleum sosnowskyi]